VTGLRRVGFIANIEETNIFMTALIFVVFVAIVVIYIGLFKLPVCEALSRTGKLKGEDKFRDFRNGWKIVVKGVLFRLVSCWNLVLNRY
jgi:Transient receptor potential (TRP) ion channel